MKMFLILISLLFLCFICYITYYVNQRISFQKMSVNDVLWVESYKEGMIVPVHIIKVDKDEKGKVIRIYLENEKSFTFNELRKSEYTL